MLGRKEEEIEREEVERQLREVEMQERVQQELNEAERQTMMQAQARGEAVGHAPGQDERNLDDDVPEAEEHDLDDDIPEDEDEDEEEHDLDEDVPEADVSGWHYDTRISSEPAEGETGITDDVERSHLVDGLHISPRFHAGTFVNGQQDAGRMPYEDEHAIAHAMLEEDELDGIGDRDLDDEVPDADMEVDEEGWEHTDTELDLEESEMDISILPPQQQGHQPPPLGVGRSQRAATPATVESSVAETGRRSWLGGSPRRNLFGRSNPGNTVGLFTPPQAVPTSPVPDTAGEDSMRPRRFGRRPRRGVNVTPVETENRDNLD